MLEQIKKYLDVILQLQDVALYILLFLSTVVRLDRKGKLILWTKKAVKFFYRIAKSKNDTAKMETLNEIVHDLDAPEEKTTKPGKNHEAN